MNFDSFFSRAAAGLRQSPIRQMGTVTLARADVISFAPGYPGPDGARPARDTRVQAPAAARRPPRGLPGEFEWARKRSASAWSASA